MSIAVSHTDLIRAASNWLTRRCSVVLTELSTTGEVPDAIGWKGTCSTLIECKVSRADFMADAKKMFRRESWMGIGNLRYYLTPVGLIELSEIPARWGLLELTSCGIQESKKPEAFPETNRTHEIRLLLSTLRRVGHNAPKSVSIRCYTIESKNTATLGVCEEKAMEAAQ